MGFEIVCDAFHERCFGTYNHHIYFVVDDKGRHVVEVADIDFHILANGSRAGISRGDIELFGFLTLGNFPCQGMLAAAASQQKDFHRG